MNILITGGTGFVGKHLALALQQLGEEVTVLGRNQEIGAELTKLGINFLPVDLTDRDRIIAATRDRDLVYHCGGLSSAWGKYVEFYRANVLAIRYMIEGCEVNQVKRLIHISSSSVYFNFTDRLNIPETAPFSQQPASDYAATKQLAELEVQQAIGRGLSAVIIRPRAIFGNGDRALLPRLIKASQTTGIPLMRSGKILIDLTYIDNLIAALLLCRDLSNRINGQVYNISNGEPIYLIDLLQLISERFVFDLRLKPISPRLAYAIATCMEITHRTLQLKQEPILTRYTVGILACSQTLDISKAQQELGYSPQISLREGIGRIKPVGAAFNF